ncbi:hypothetical protein ALQ51_03096 [Pseudomonas cannabina]|uniref:Uncharacterized protein n=1 Tax=Pseudomonas cannabina TaxID=86840 RepID=A0A3M3R4H5_PSECA|nr:hypothetical protein ALQ51_03096 [Pseudomonas cannabina]
MLMVIWKQGIEAYTARAKTGTCEPNHPEIRKPRNARLSKVVGPHGLEPWTKGL